MIILNQFMKERIHSDVSFVILINFATKGKMKNIFLLDLLLLMKKRTTYSYII